MIVIVDYGMGNLRSVSKALESLGAPVRVSSDPGEVARADKLILPGVGAFGAAMDVLTRQRLVEPIKAAIGQGRPYLGICLGLQLLFDSSEESPGVAGLSIFKGTVKRFAFSSHLPGPPRSLAGAGSPPRPAECTCRGGLTSPARRVHVPGRAHLKVPHMGWNQVNSTQQTAHSRQRPCPLLRDVPDGSFFYFVHSYFGAPMDRTSVALETDYGIRFAAMLWKDRLFATQFHPEKSQALGLRLLENFIAL